MVRIKHRYLVFQLSSSNSGEEYNPTKTNLINSLIGPFTEKYGDFGTASVFPSLRVVTWDQEKKIGVIKLMRSWAETFKEFLESHRNIGTYQIKFSVHHVSGTIDQAQHWIDTNYIVFN